MKNHTIFFTKGQKSLFIYLFTLLTSYCFAQETSINTTNPLGIFHIDAKGDNPPKDIPAKKEQDNDFIIKVNGNTGIGTVNPTNKLHIVANENYSPLKIDNLPIGDISKDEVLLINENNVIKKSNSIQNIITPTYAIFRLNKNIVNFLISADEGGSEMIPMTNIYNGISGLQYDPNNATITFPKGTYQVELTYTADRKYCLYSSYYINFPEGDFLTTQIYNTSRHPTDGGSHAGQFSHVFTSNRDRIWEIHMGRGRSGECWGYGTTLSKNNTQLIVTKLN